MRQLRPLIKKLACYLGYHEKKMRKEKKGKNKKTISIAMSTLHWIVFRNDAKSY